MVDVEKDMEFYAKEQYRKQISQEMRIGSFAMMIQIKLTEGYQAVIKLCRTTFLRSNKERHDDQVDERRRLDSEHYIQARRP